MLWTFADLLMDDLLALEGTCLASVATRPRYMIPSAYFPPLEHVC